MAIDVKTEGIQLTKLFEKRALDEQELALAKALQDEIVEIVRRTKGGKDEDSTSFRPYSPGYAEYRKSKGRREKPVDLTFTGQMLNSIQTRARRAGNKIEGIIFFASAREAAKARANERRGRKFFALSPKQVDAIFRKMQNALKRT